MKNSSKSNKTGGTARGAGKSSTAVANAQPNPKKGTGTLLGKK